MATIKIKFRASSIENKAGTVFYQVIHNRVSKQINSGYKIYPEEWNNLLACVILPPPQTVRYNYLSTLEKQIAKDLQKLKNIIIRLQHSNHLFTSEKIVELYHISPTNNGFLEFARELTNQLRQIGRERTAETYTTVLNSFERFMNKREDIPIDEIESNLITEYETYLKRNDICPNSTSYYMRNLRAIYNRAVEKKLTVQRTPFKHVYTGIDKTMKRAIPLEVIRRIKDKNLTPLSTLDYARDIFLFSFYTRGMSFIDMAYLKKNDLQNGVLSYRRHKTNQQFFIKWEKPMEEIISKYSNTESPYLLPIIKDSRKDTRKQYKSAAHLINQKLKILGKMIDSPVTLTTYVARHTWANIAKSKNISISIISEAMGHDSENTTRIYLASLDTSIVDKANKLILKSL